VVCHQEGSGPCFFCGELVCTRDEEKLLRRGGAEATALKQKLYKDFLNGGLGDKCNSLPEVECVALTPRNNSAELEKAMDAKNRLLEFDRTSEKRTTVIDDECDYFAVNSEWLTDEERVELRSRLDELRKQRHTPRSELRFTLDFAGRKVISDTGAVSGMYGSRRSDSVEKGEVLNRHGFHHNEFPDGDVLHPSPAICIEYYEDSLSDNGSSTRDTDNRDNEFGIKTASNLAKQSRGATFRIQDSCLAEMSDGGWCLSMHQPHASLLVAGIKRDEGRSWYSSHRGRLWIAATTKAPDKEEIKTFEELYRKLGREKVIPFPEDYPTGCLLGCVDMVDCLPQEQYLNEYPDGESTSPYVFVCRNPHELVVRFPIQGRHKLYKLEPQIHRAARKSILRLKEDIAGSNE
jgi:hypothetical protein